MDRTFGVWPSGWCLRASLWACRIICWLENNWVFFPRRERAREHMRPNRIIQATYINRKSCTDSFTSVAFQSIEAFYSHHPLCWMVTLEIGKGQHSHSNAVILCANALWCFYISIMMCFDFELKTGSTIGELSLHSSCLSHFLWGVFSKINETIQCWASMRFCLENECISQRSRVECCNHALVM